MTKRLGFHREQLLSMLLIPAIVMSSMPKTACICSDGHRELFCAAMACRALHVQKTESSACGCSCCEVTHDAHSKGCSHPKTCCSNNGTQPAPDGVSALNGCCCHPLIEAPAPVVVSKRAEQPTENSLALSADSLPVLLAAIELYPAFLRNNTSAPPPLDVVIVYLHLTI